MARLRVPENRLEGLAKTFSLSNETFQALVKALSGFPITLFPREVLSKTISNVGSIPPEDSKIICESLLSLCMVRANSDKSITDFINDVIKSIHELNSDKLRLSEEEKKNFSERFRTLLDNESLTVSARATSLLFEYERAFHRARILTDIRPVFQGQADTPPNTALLVHMLRLTYHQSDERGHKEFHVSMDDEDLQDLIDVLNRAKIKAKTLKKLLLASKITCIDRYHTPG